MERFKNVLKNVLKSLIVKKAIIIAIIFILIFVILLPAIVYFITLDDAEYKEGDYSSTSFAASEYVKNAKFSEKGITFTYRHKDEQTGEEIVEEISSGEMAKIIWDKMMQEGSEVDSYLYNVNELEKLMNAELVTQYPKLDEDVDFNGTIEFERHKTDGTNIKLKYINQDKFKEYITANNKEALNYYTLNDSGNLVVAVLQKTTSDFSTNDSENGENSQRIVENVVTKTVNYKSAISKYTMPFQYLWDFIVASDDKDFSLALADLVNNSQIIISIYDNIKTTVSTSNQTYKKERKTETYARVTPYMDLTNEKYWVENPIEGAYCEDADYSIDDQTYSVTSTMTQEVDTPIIDITKADVWIIEYLKEYTYQANSLESEENNEAQLDNEEYVEDEGSPQDSVSNPELLNNEKAVGFAQEFQANAQALENQIAAQQQRDANEIYTDVEYVSVSNFTHNIDINKKENTQTSSQGYVAETPISRPKVEKDVDEVNFVTLLSSAEYSIARQNIVEISDWLFEMLESENSTANMVDLTKYLLYKVTGNDYGVTEFDFGIYDQSAFKDISSSATGQSSQLLKEYIRSWEGCTAINSDGTKYIIQDDGAGHPTVGHGIDIENSGYKQRFIENGYPTTLGGEVDIDFVDAIEDEIINSMLETVKSMTAGLNLTGYQINALVSRAFNCGAGGAITVERNGYDFVSAYNAFWDSDRDDKLKSEETEGDFTHSLFTQYMSKPDTSGGKVLAGLERRRKSEWTLFQTGYYDTLGKRHSSVSDGGILAAADEVHQEEITWTYYSTAGDLYWSDIEKSMNNPNKATCCATYVSCVIYRAGYFTENEMNTFNYNECGSLYSFLTSAGWSEINSYDELEAGDIVFMNYNDGGKAYDHVQIYAGDDTWYNAGDTSAIQKASPFSQGNWARSNFFVALRAN